MSKKGLPPIFKEKGLGILIFTGAQLFIGFIHLFIGLLLLVTPVPFLQETPVYDVYTVLFGLLVMVFAVLVWQGKKAGWIGTVVVSVFVIVADSLTLLNLPSIPGIPKFAGATEISYSLIIIGYLSLGRVRKNFLGKNQPVKQRRF
jgi:hypothetical protein